MQKIKNPVIHRSIRPSNFGKITFRLLGKQIIQKNNSIYEEGTPKHHILSYRELWNKTTKHGQRARSKQDLFDLTKTTNNSERDFRDGVLISYE